MGWGGEARDLQVGAKSFGSGGSPKTCHWRLGLREI